MKIWLLALAALPLAAQQTTPAAQETPAAPVASTPETTITGSVDLGYRFNSVGGSLDAFRSVVELNLVGTFLPVLVFGKAMVATGRGSIINISSMTAKLPMSRTAGYGSAKAGVDNLTGWLADHLARQFGQGVRVNAIAPGFFLGDQNRALLTCPDGSFTPRGQAVVSRTPMGRLGDPEDLVGTAVWLASDASAFVTGVVVPVDGGFSAAAGI